MKAHSESLGPAQAHGRELGGCLVSRAGGREGPRPGQGGDTHTPSMLSSSSWKALAASSCSRWALEAACCSVEGPAVTLYSARWLPQHPMQLTVCLALCWGPEPGHCEGGQPWDSPGTWT